jgi:hypothetical protein
VLPQIPIGWRILDDVYVSAIWLGGVRVLSEALAALASTGGTALITAMVTDGWEGVRTRFARLLGRGDTAETETVAARLEQSKALLATLSGGELERARAEQAIAWRTRLEDLLEHDPAAAGTLRTLVAEIKAQAVESRGRVEQHATAHDQAQQVVQGHGVQNVSFGAQRGSDASQR